MSCTYRFVNSCLPDVFNDREYIISLRQQPERAKLSVPNERDKRSIEPPPIIQLQWLNCKEEEKKQYLQSPFYFMIVNIIHAERSSVLKPLPTKEYLSGATVSSLHKLRDLDNTDGGFFVFGDLAVKKQGNFKLHFSLFEITDGEVKNRKNLLSNAFRVYPPKQYPGPIEATFLSRTFSDQGVKIRVKKDSRITRANRAIGCKRKYENHTSISVDYSIKKEIQLSPPSYAVDHDVHFGRWQSTTTSHHNKKPTISPILSSSSPTLSQTSNYSLPPITSLVTTSPEKFQYRLPPLTDILKSDRRYSTTTDDFYLPIDHSFFT